MKIFSLALSLISAFNVAVAAAPSEPMPQLLPAVEHLANLASVAARPGISEGAEVMEVTITAYSSTPDQTDDTPFITASGTRTRDGVVAANFLPFGTEVQIPELFGSKVFVVEDRMHQRFSNRMDIWFPERATAKNFGVQQAMVVVL